MLLSEIDDELVCLILGFIHPKDLKNVACVSVKFRRCTKETLRTPHLDRIRGLRSVFTVKLGYYDGLGLDCMHRGRLVDRRWISRDSQCEIECRVPSDHSLLMEQREHHHLKHKKQGTKSC